MKGKNRIRVFMIFISLFLISIVSGTGIQLVCLEEGQTIEFSECNPSIEDKTCGSTTCQMCVNEISSGVYCPASLNSCNDAGIEECSYLDENNEEPEITLVSPSDLYVAEDEDEIDFQFEVSKSYTIDKCELIFDDEIVAESEGRIQSSVNEISYYVEEGSYLWEIKCVTREGDRIVYSEKRSLTISGEQDYNNNQTDENETQEDIELVEPVDKMSLTGTRDVNFVFEVSFSSV
jgi:hypothetical protein